MDSGYLRWVTGKRDRIRTVNSVRPSFKGYRDSTTTTTATVTAPATGPSRIDQPWPGLSSRRSPSTGVRIDPGIGEFRRSEDAFNYRRFSKYESEASERRDDASKPDDADPNPGYEQGYRGRFGWPATSARPPDRLKVSTCPFVATTEYRDQYRAWQAAPSYPRRDTYTNSTYTMDQLLTSYAQASRGLQGDPPASARPPANMRLGISPFDVPNRETLNREVPNREAANREAANREAPNREAPAEYQRTWLVPPPQRYRAEYVRPKGKTEFSTSYGQDFRSQERSMRFLILPRDQIRLPKGAFLDKTTYNSDF